MNNQNIKNIEWQIVRSDLEPIMYLVTKDPVRVIQVNKPDPDLQVKLDDLDQDFLHTVLDLSTDIGAVFNVFLIEGDCMDVDDIEDITQLTADKINTAIDKLIEYDLLIKSVNRSGVEYMDMTPFGYVIYWMAKGISAPVFM